jgi:asparagine synthase (glutamine-hydrolysing)
MRMQSALRHRGPDGCGVFIDAAAGLSLAHTRLSIRDLSPMGAQPMASADERFVVTYNGELYGLDALWRQLKRDGHTFRGHSDTEVLVEATARWGVIEAARRVEGIFAYAVWDKQQRRLWLVRDRVGVKPLYVAPGSAAHGVAFASELEALRYVPRLDLVPSPAAAAAFFELGYVPDTTSIYSGVTKVQPGQAWCFFAPDAPPSVHDYHDRRATALGCGASRITDLGTACDQLSRTIQQAVEKQLVSDVPVGVFLSGGIDSSVVAAAAARVRGSATKTFCIGFEDPRFDESGSARAIAAHLGTQHHELVLTPGAVVDAAKAAASAFSEPFADSSLVPTWLVCKFAREHVTVALSGDGGDELFGGYNRHVWLPRVMGAHALLPPTLRTAMAHAIQRLSPDVWDRLLAPLPFRTPGLKAHKLARLLAASGDAAVVREAASTGPLATGFVRAEALHTVMQDMGDARGTLMFHDFTSYLPGDILPKVDRTSMALGLEARVPLLDDSVVALAGRLAPELKIRRGVSKWVLREVLAQSVPRSLFERPKMGFAIPLADWLRGPLRPWADDMLSLASLERSGILDVDAADHAWRRFLAGAPMHEFGVWSLLMWQTWWLQSRSTP